MIVALVALGLVAVAALAVAALAIRALERARESAIEERAHLEDRLIAVVNPEALLTKRATDPGAPGGDVSYVDEEREYELEHEAKP